METPSPELLEAYRRTKFIVDQPDGETIIRHGECNHDIGKMLLEHAVRSGAFITAHNPHSQRLSENENRNRHLALIADVEKQGLPYFTGRGVGAEDWPAEESLFVLGVSRDLASMLGRKYGQVAIVWVEADRAAEVVLC
jgi:sugar phosphate isomerase/epimerase